MLVTLFLFSLRRVILSKFTHMALAFGLHCYERHDHCVHCGPYLRLSPATSHLALCASARGPKRSPFLPGTQVAFSNEYIFIDGVTCCRSTSQVMIDAEKLPAVPQPVVPIATFSKIVIDTSM